MSMRTNILRIMLTVFTLFFFICFYDFDGLVLFNFTHTLWGSYIGKWKIWVNRSHQSVENLMWSTPKQSKINHVHFVWNVLQKSTYGILYRPIMVWFTAIFYGMVPFTPQKRCPEETASFLSNVTFSWIAPWVTLHEISLWLSRLLHRLIPAWWL